MNRLLGMMATALALSGPVPGVDLRLGPMSPGRGGKPTKDVRAAFPARREKARLARRARKHQRALARARE